MPALKERKKKPLPVKNGSELDELLLDLLPRQGSWREEEYLWLTESTKKLIEFTDGFLELLPMPTDKHQAISQFLLYMIAAYLKPLGGKVQYSPLRLRIRPGKFREPDLLALLNGKDPRRQNRYWLGADLVVEIVSPDNPKRDVVEKRKDYAEGKIPEYWIVNPMDETFTVLTLARKKYKKHGAFRRNQTMTSVLLAGFSIDVDALFDAD